METKLPSTGWVAPSSTGTEMARAMCPRAERAGKVVRAEPTDQTGPPWHFPALATGNLLVEA